MHSRSCIDFSTDHVKVSSGFICYHHSRHVSPSVSTDNRSHIQLSSNTLTVSFLFLLLVYSFFFLNRNWLKSSTFLGFLPSLCLFVFLLHAIHIIPVIHVRIMIHAAGSKLCSNTKQRIDLKRKTPFPAFLRTTKWDVPSTGNGNSRTYATCRKSYSFLCMSENTRAPASGFFHIGLLFMSVENCFQSRLLPQRKNRLTSRSVYLTDTLGKEMNDYSRRAIAPTMLNCFNARIDSFKSVKIWSAL